MCFNVNKNIKVELFLKQLKEFTKMNPFAKASLHFDGQILSGSKKLSDYNIQKDDTLELTIPIAGGGCAIEYLDVSKENLVKEKVIKGKPNHLSVIPGLNLECKCTSKNCKFNGQRVICPIGEGTHNFLAQEENHNKTKCPICETSAFSENCGFYRCYY